MKKNKRATAHSRSNSGMLLKTSPHLERPSLEVMTKDAGLTAADNQQIEHLQDSPTLYSLQTSGPSRHRPSFSSFKEQDSAPQSQLMMKLPSQLISKQMMPTAIHKYYVKDIDASFKPPEVSLDPPVPRSDTSFKRLVHSPDRDQRSVFDINTQSVTNPRFSSFLGSVPIDRGLSIEDRASLTMADSPVRLPLTTLAVSKSVDRKPSAIGSMGRQAKQVTERCEEANHHEGQDATQQQVINHRLKSGSSILALKSSSFKRCFTSDNESPLKPPSSTLDDPLHQEIRQLKRERDRLLREKNEAEAKFRAAILDKSQTKHFIQLLGSSSERGWHPTGQSLEALQLTEADCLHCQDRQRKEATEALMRKKQADKIRDLEIDNSALRSQVMTLESKLRKSEQTATKYRLKYSNLKELSRQAKQTQFLELTGRLDLNDSSNTVKFKTTGMPSHVSATSKHLESHQLAKKNKAAVSTLDKSSSETSMKQSFFIDQHGAKSLHRSKSLESEEESNSRIMSTEMIINPIDLESK